LRGGGDGGGKQHGRPTGENNGVDFETFKDITSFADWAEVEQRAANSKK